MSENIDALCAELSLTAIADHYATCADEAAKKKRPFVKYLEQVLGAEEALRAKRSQRMLIKLTTFPVVKTLEQFDFEGAPKARLQALSGLAFVVTVNIAELLGKKVYLISKVADPEVLVVNPQVDVTRALSMLGGTTSCANLSDFRILRKTGNKKYVPRFSYNDVDQLPVDALRTANVSAQTCAARHDACRSTDTEIASRTRYAESCAGTPGRIE